MSDLSLKVSDGPMIPKAGTVINPIVVVLLLICISIAGCTRTFRVVSPPANQVSSQDFEIVDDKIRILVTFNRAVDMSSLVAEQNVILDTESDANADITISSISPTEIQIESVGVLGDLFDFDPDGFFELRLLGDGAQPIRDGEGAALDGDKDGSPGGVYETRFTVLG